MEPLTLLKLISQTNKLIISHRPIFTSLSTLFIFPSTLAALIYTNLIKNISPNSQTTPQFPNKTILITIAYFLFTLILSTLATGSITFTAFRGLKNDQIDLKSATESAFKSFFPLIATKLCITLVVFVATFVFAFIVVAIFSASSILLDSAPPPYVIVIPIVVFVLFLSFYVRLNWFLSDAVVVAESSWGFGSLKRSKVLMKGKRKLALRLVSIFGVVGSLIVYLTTQRDSFYSEAVKVCLLVLVSVLMTVMNLYNLVADAVLYVYCVAEKEYLSLAVDEDVKYVLIV